MVRMPYMYFVVCITHKEGTRTFPLSVAFFSHLSQISSLLRWMQKCSAFKWIILTYGDNWSNFHLHIIPIFSSAAIKFMYSSCPEAGQWILGSIHVEQWCFCTEMSWSDIYTGHLESSKFVSWCLINWELVKCDVYGLWLL